MKRGTGIPHRVRTNALADGYLGRLKAEKS